MLFLLIEVLRLSVCPAIPLSLGKAETGKEVAQSIWNLFGIFLEGEF
jgi:hypothetical protein